MVDSREGSIDTGYVGSPSHVNYDSGYLYSPAVLDTYNIIVDASWGEAVKKHTSRKSKLIAALRAYNAGERIFSSPGPRTPVEPPKLHGVRFYRQRGRMRQATT